MESGGSQAGGLRFSLAFRKHSLGRPAVFADGSSITYDPQVLPDSHRAATHRPFHDACAGLRNGLAVGWRHSRDMWRHVAAADYAPILCAPTLQ